MKSKTKFLTDDETIRKLYLNAGYKQVTGIKLLGNGEFNAVYEAVADGRPTALKISPPSRAEVMQYENGMMKAELYWYEQIRKNTSIRVPAVYHRDFSRRLIDADWFIMEKLEGEQMDTFAFSKDEKTQSQNILAEMAGEIHNITGEKFGYIQNKLYDNWYLALRSAVKNLLSDCAKKGRRSRRGETFLGCIDRGKNIFEKAPCTMVNYDIWAANVICRRKNQKVEYAWIDPERSFWGDPLLDFCCLDFLTPLEKKHSVQAHNRVSAVKIRTGREEKIRYAASLAMMALIMETEKYYRYTPCHFGYWRNTIISGILYRTAFKELKKL